MIICDFFGRVTDSKSEANAPMLHLYVVDMTAPVSSSATSPLCFCTDSVPIPSAPGKRQMQTFACSKQSQDSARPQLEEA